MACAQISMDFFLATGLGLGSTEHGDEPKEGQVGRRGISCERTFARISAVEDLEAKVRPCRRFICIRKFQRAAAAVVWPLLTTSLFSAGLESRL